MQDMTDKTRVCFNVDKKTAMLVKLYKTEVGNAEMNNMINGILHRTLSNKLKEKGINLKVNASISKTCPKCNKGELINRTGKGGEFYGCSTYPSCKFTKPIE